MSCWECKFQNINKQDTLLGYCNWFFDFKLEDPKQIPPDVVEKGCSKFQSKVPRNASEAFKKDHAAGGETENKVLNRIREEYPKAYQKQGYFKEYDIMIPEINTTVEVKQDKKSNYTGNIVIEVEMPPGKPSALSTTTADYWLFSDGNCYMWWTPEDLKELVKPMRPTTFIGNGDDVEKKAYLVKKTIIKDKAIKVVAE